MGAVGMAYKVIVYKCVVCGASFNKRESLMAHMKKHKDVEWGYLHVRVPKPLLDWFFKFCEDHNTTTCQMIVELFDMLKGKTDDTIIKILGHNPYPIIFQHVYLAKPRGHGKYDFSNFSDFQGIPEEPKCVLCGAPAIAEGVQDNGWRFGYCHKHRWLQNWAPMGYVRKKGEV